MAHSTGSDCSIHVKWRFGSRRAPLCVTRRPPSDPLIFPLTCRCVRVRECGCGCLVPYRLRILCPANPRITRPHLGSYFTKNPLSQKLFGSLGFRYNLHLRSLRSAEGFVCNTSKRRKALVTSTSDLWSM